MRVMREVLQRGFSRRRRCRVPGEPILLCLGGFFSSFYYLLLCALLLRAMYSRSGWGIGLGRESRCVYLL